MPHVNDKKLESLETVLTATGHIDDLEIEWLQSHGATSDNINDAWIEVMQLNGATSDNFSDAARQFLDTVGATQGHVTDQWWWFWTQIGDIPAGGWEYASLALAESSGDPWQDGDDVQITGGALFRYRSNAAADGYSGLAHKEPYGSGLGILGAVSIKNSTPVASDPDTWVDQTITSNAPATVDVDGGRSRIMTQGTDDMWVQALSDLSLGATENESFFILDKASAGQSGVDSTAATNTQINLWAAKDAGNSRGIGLFRGLARMTNWYVRSGASGTTYTDTGKSVAAERRIWMYVKDGRWAVWFDADSTPALASTTPRELASVAKHTVIWSGNGKTTFNCYVKLNQMVSGVMTTA